MKAYSYSPIIKEYTGKVDCQINPLEKGYLLPGNSTFEKPPITQEKQIAIWNDKWEIKSNHRGEVYWDKESKEEQRITEIGESQKENWTKLQPISERAIWEVDKWIEPPLTFEELQEKEEAEFAIIMPDIVKELQAKVQILEEQIETAKEIAK